ncbi:MAG: hypothetical protein V3U29_05070 [Phycisphaeraceae bacterium]
MFNRFSMFTAVALVVVAVIRPTCLYAEVSQKERDATLADWQQLVDEQKRLHEKVFSRVSGGVHYDVDVKTVELIEDFEKNDLPALQQLLEAFAGKYGRTAADIDNKMRQVFAGAGRPVAMPKLPGAGYTYEQLRQGIEKVDRTRKRTAEQIAIDAKTVMDRVLDKQKARLALAARLDPDNESVTQLLAGLGQAQEQVSETVAELTDSGALLEPSEDRVGPTEGFTGRLVKLALAALLVVSGLLAAGGKLRPRSPNLGPFYASFAPLRTRIGVATLVVGALSLLWHVRDASLFGSILPQLSAVAVGLVLWKQAMVIKPAVVTADAAEQTSEQSGMDTAQHETSVGQPGTKWAPLGFACIVLGLLHLFAGGLPLI